MKLLLGLLFVVSTTLTTSAQAGLLLEPFAGTLMSSKFKSGSTEKDLSGTMMGARLGFQNFGFMFGLDVSQGSLKIKDSTDGFSSSVYSAFVGYDFPILLRAWVKMNLSGEGKSGATTYTNPSGTFIGIGYKMIPFLSINFETGTTTYKKWKSGASTGDHDFGFSMSILSLSFPLSL
jgi:hypothetical protein